MHKLKEILRQKLMLGHSHREVAASLRVSIGKVGGVCLLARGLGLEWPAVERMADEELELKLYPRAETPGVRVEPDWGQVHLELRRKGVTLLLLNVEYLERHPGGYRYSAFCGRYHEWLRKHSPVMRQVHHAGDKMFIDYAGTTLQIVDPATGEVSDAQVFVAVLGASNYTYAEVTRTQKVWDFCGSVARAMVHFGGVPAAVVPDNLKSGVTKACRYEPQVQRTFQELAQHFGTTVLPARPRRPRDKAKVEAGVQVVTRWITARLRHERLGSVAEANVRVAELLDVLNDRTMRVYGESRRQLFERMERPALRPLPARPYEVAVWEKVRLNVDYHADVDGHYYSAHHSLIHEQLWSRSTQATVELFHGGTRVASHKRSRMRGGHTTVPEHMPRSHREHAEWTPSRILGWASKIGPGTRTLCEAILAQNHHPEWGYRSCLGIFRLSKRYGADRLEQACRRAHAAGARSYKSVASILERGLDKHSEDERTTQRLLPLDHENIRGGDYYH
jgi:transposase